MASPRSAGENGAEDGVDAVGDAFQLVTQELGQLQEALRQQKQEAERKVQEAEGRMQEALRLQKQKAEREIQEALHLHKQEAERKVQEAENRMQEALRLQEERASVALREVERKLQEKDDAIRALQQRLEETQESVTAVEERRTEVLRLQEERAATALRDMDRKMQEKDDAIRALQQRLEETHDRVMAAEERTMAPEGSEGDGGLRRLEGRVNDVEASLQSAVQTFMPRVEALLRQLEESQSTSASLATSAASAREAPVTGGVAAGGGEEPPSSSSTPTPTRAGRQGAAADEEQRARSGRMELPLEVRVREVELRRERARTSPSPLEEQLCEATDKGNLIDALCFIDSGADVNYIGREGYTPLFNAAWLAHADLMSLLLQRGADPNAVTCGGGSSVLHFAAAKDSSGRCVELLVRAGADVDARDIDGETPLHRAAYNNNEEAVRALLAAGARRDLKPCKGRWKNKTPLELATSTAVRDLLRG